MGLHFQTRREPSRSGEDGYVMLMLLLVIALIIISAAVIVPTIKFQIQYDREEEMIHRGVQYERAIRTYYKKFSRYPIRLEDLENTNNLRFLRKRYKDPMNCSHGKCQDFRLLHFGEVQLALSGAFGGAGIPGASPIGSQAGLGGGSGLGQTSSFGGNSAFGQNSSFGGNSAFGSNSGSTFGGNQTAGNAAPGSDSSQSSSSEAGSQPAGPNTSTPGDDTNSGSSSASGGTSLTPLLATGPIVGVATFSKKTGYREFNHKKKYNEWQFIYDPGTDRGGLPTTPYQPSLLAGVAGAINPNGQNNNSNGSGTGSSFGSSSSFGGSSSFGSSPSGAQNSPNSPSGGFGTPSQPSNPQQQ